MATSMRLLRYGARGTAFYRLLGGITQTSTKSLGSGQVIPISRLTTTSYSSWNGVSGPSPLRLALSRGLLYHRAFSQHSAVLQGNPVAASHLLTSRTFFTLRTQGLQVQTPVKVCVRGFINKSKRDRRGKKGKRKTRKAVLKRFIRTGKGKLKFWLPGKNHNLLKKGARKRAALRKPVYCNPQQYRLINKMLNGW